MICHEIISIVLLRAVLAPGDPVSASACQAGKLNLLLHNVAPVDGSANSGGLCGQAAKLVFSFQNNFK